MIRTEYIPEDFYSTYEEHREYVFPNIGKKHIRDFRKNFLANCEFRSNMSVLEIGCGTGLFLKFLETQGISDFYGIDADPKVLEFMPETLKKKVGIFDVEEYLSSLNIGKKFDRVVLIDVLEHFNPSEGANLLEILIPFLKQNGGIVVRVPNLASPWGLQWQFHDLTHKAAYTSGSLKQLGLKVGLDCQVFPHRRGNPRKQLLEKFFHSTIEMFLTERPEFWSANIIGYFGRKKE